MHDIDRLSNDKKSNIRSAVYEVLREYAEGGNHDGLFMKNLFLKTADNLVKAKIIEKPGFLGGNNVGGQKFITLVNGRQPDQFPNYGIPDNIAELIRQIFWDLTVQGVLAPSTQTNPLKDQGHPTVYQDYWVSFEYMMITPYGVEVLVNDKDKIKVHDSNSYLSNFKNLSIAPDYEMMVYLQEAIEVFRNRHFYASVVLLGISSERLIEFFAENLRDIQNAKGTNGTEGTAWFNQKYVKQKQISNKFDAIKAVLDQPNFSTQLKTKNLKTPLDNIIVLTFNIIRMARNDIAHPTGRSFTWNEVSGFFHNFVQYFIYVNKIIECLKS